MNEPFHYGLSHGVGLLQAPQMASLGFACALSTRVGGVSIGETATMNLSFKRRDTEENVRENYRRLAVALGRPLESLCLSRQVHGVEVLEANEMDAHRSLAPGAVSREGDAWISDDPALTLIRHHADCTPVYLADPEHRAMGLIHAGWKGTVHAIASRTLSAMVRRYGSRPERMWALIGPAISACCFEIGPDVAQLLEDGFPGAGLVQRRGDSLYGDLKACNRLQLLQGGIPECQILTSSLCTSCCHDLLYSHRRERGHTGIMASIMYRL